MIQPLKILCVYVSVHVCATYLLFLSCSKPITFQYSPSNFLDIITGLVYTGLYWGCEVIFLCVYFYAHVYVCMYMYICICVCIYKYIYYHILYVYVCVCLCMYVCMYVYVYMNIDVYIFRVRFSFQVFDLILYQLCYFRSFFLTYIFYES